MCFHHHTQRSRGEVNAAASEWNLNEGRPPPKRSRCRAAWQQRSDNRPPLNDSIRQLSPSAKCQDAPIPVCYTDQLHTHDEGRRNLSSFASFHRDGAAASDGSRVCHVPQAVCRASVDGSFFLSSIVNTNLTFNLSEKKHKNGDSVGPLKFSVYEKKLLQNSWTCLYVVTQDSYVVAWQELIPSGL